jgi:hypothetical protein
LFEWKKPCFLSERYVNRILRKMVVA